MGFSPILLLQRLLEQHCIELGACLGCITVKGGQWVWKEGGRGCVWRGLASYSVFAYGGSGRRKGPQEQLLSLTWVFYLHWEASVGGLKMTTSSLTPKKGMGSDRVMVIIVTIGGFLLQFLNISLWNIMKTNSTLLRCHYGRNSVTKGRNKKVWQTVDQL